MIGFNEIFLQLTALKLGVYTPVSYILPSRLAEVRGHLRHRGQRRQGEAQAEGPRAKPALLDDGESAQAS